MDRMTVRSDEYPNVRF